MKYPPLSASEGQLGFYWLQGLIDLRLQVICCAGGASLSNNRRAVKLIVPDAAM